MFYLFAQISLFVHTVDPFCFLFLHSIYLLTFSITLFLCLSSPTKMLASWRHSFVCFVHCWIPNHLEHSRHSIVFFGICWNTAGSMPSFGSLSITWEISVQLWKSQQFWRIFWRLIEMVMYTIIDIKLYTRKCNDVILLYLNKIMLAP